MSEREEYPEGVPCWVDAMVPDPAAAQAFYAGLFGWEFAEPRPVRGRAARRASTSPASARSSGRRGTPTCASTALEAARRARDGGGRRTCWSARPTRARGPGCRGRARSRGAAIVLWEPRRAASASRLVNEPGTWTMSSLHVVETGAAAAFYGAVFGWQAEAFGPMTLFRLPDHVGGEEGQPIPRDVVAVMAPPDANVPPHWNVNFRVADADAIAASAADSAAACWSRRSTRRAFATRSSPTRRARRSRSAVRVGCFEAMDTTRLSTADATTWFPVGGQDIHVSDLIDQASRPDAEMTVGFARIGAGETLETRSPTTRS